MPETIYVYIEEIKKAQYLECRYWHFNYIRSREIINHFVFFIEENVI